MDDDTTVVDPSALSIDQVWSLLYKDSFIKFLSDYGDSYYPKQAIEIARHGYNGFILHVHDIATWEEGTALAAFLTTNFLFVWDYLNECIDQFVKRVLEEYLNNNSAGLDAIASALLFDGTSKKYHLVLDVQSQTTITVRQLRSEQIGRILKLRGTVIRLSDVRPLLVKASFRCNVCGTIQHNLEQVHKLTEPTHCTKTDCSNRTQWTLLPEFSEFEDWQKIRVQENSEEIPAGSMPRAIDVIVMRSQCDRCKPGDKIIVTGSLAAIPDVPSLMRPGDIPKSVQADRNRALRSEMGLADNSITGLRKLGVRDLGHKLCYFGADIHTAVDEMASKAMVDNDTAALNQQLDLHSQFDLVGLTVEEQNLFLRIAKSNDTLDRLVASFAPEVYGCENIKKGILLMLAGGVMKRTGAEGLRLRGDINVCIVGDPGTAKSQLLKYVRNFAPRAVYTAGNTSSAAGLTVSVHRDREQGEGVIEAGALMLADTGVCCIDEFEKMNVKDMVAIHEAVEQQTISICKGGVHAVLNARAAILAACNPRNSRYDPSMPFRHNVRLSAPIISRFDLFFALIDNTEFDEQVARHIVENHSGSTAPLFHGELTKKQLQNYIKIAKDRQPTLSSQAQHMLVQCYVELREECSKPGAGRAATVTVRSLESLIRLSEAAAKLKLADQVTEEHVRLAIRVVQTSLVRLRKAKILLDQEDSIDAEEYNQISTNIIERFRDAELQLTRETAGAEKEAVAEKDDLVSWYVEEWYSSESLDEETLMAKYQLVSKVIDQMVTRDMSLIEDVKIVDDEQRIIILRLHPNFAETTEEPPAHATLGTETLADQLVNEQPATESWGLDDDDFLKHVYG